MQAVGEANGPLLLHLAKLIKYHDVRCVDMLRVGGPLIGKLPCSGNGVPILGQTSGLSELEALLNEREARNRSLVSSLREDPHATDLLKMAASDAALGRMSRPRHLRESDLREYTLSPRFCLEQGLKADGSPKLRAIDDMSRSGVNACTFAAEKLKCDTLDCFFETLRVMSASLQEDFGLWKADIDSAFRRVPIKAAHREYAAVVWVRGGKTFISVHHALPFGSIASVHGWDRIGAFLQ